jgi:hypothetical protein
MSKDLIYTCIDSKKVNYILILNVANRVLLKTVISDLTLRAALDIDGFFSKDILLPYINQTTY